MVTENVLITGGHYIDVVRNYMHKYRIELITTSDIMSFVNIVTAVNGSVKLIDDTGFCVNGKSLLGAMATVEWNSLYCVSEEDIYTKIERFCKG